MIDRINRTDRRKIGYSVIAVLCFVILLAVGGQTTGRKAGDAFSGTEVADDSTEEVPDENTESTAQDYDMVVLGDSIMAQSEMGGTPIPARLEALLGLNVYNGALGGTGMGRVLEVGTETDMMDSLSMVGLSKAIVSGDFRIQKAIEVEGYGAMYFSDTIAGLSEIDFSKVKVLLIEHCVNDYHAGEPIYPTETSDDEDTYVGALCSSVKTLQEAYPDLRIVFVTPTFTWYLSRELTCEEYVREGKVLEDYVNAQLATAEELGLEIIDLYHDVYPHDTWSDWEKYSWDGLHPNEEGRALLAQIIADYLIQNPEKP